MKYIVISGIDGSGKTTIIKELQDTLHRRGIKTHYIWMRYNHYFVKILNALARLLNLSVKKTYGEKKVWEHQYYKSPAFFKFYIFFAYVDNVLAACKVKIISRKKFHYVICDRWINDIIADIGSEFRREDLLKSHWYVMFQNILPKNTVQFVITRPDRDIIEARDDNKYDTNFMARLGFYKKLGSMGNAIEIDNSGSVADSVSLISKKI